MTDQVTEEDINSEVELLNSQDLLRKVVVETGLAASSVPGRNTDVEVARAVRKLGKELKIEPLRKSNVIAVHYSAPNPWLADRVLTALSTAYTEKHLQVHRSSGELKFFDQQMEQYQHGLRRRRGSSTHSQNRRVSYRRRWNGMRRCKQADEFDASARQAQAALVEAQKRISALTMQTQSIQPRSVTVVRTSDNPQLMQQLKSTLLTLELKKTELLTKYAPTYRLVQEVEEQISEDQKRDFRGGK